MPTDAPPERGGRRFDAGFADAVKRGLLSPKQATERGRRDAYAARIRRRHGLSEEQSYAVADNRISLIAAIQSRHEPVSSTRSGRFLSGAFAVVLMLGAAAWFLDARGDLLYRRASGDVIREAGQQALQYRPAASGSNERLQSEVAGGTPARALPGSPEVEVDESGAPVRVTASNPSAVLQAYCGIDLACDLAQPVELAPAVPASSGYRIGLFTDALEGQRRAMWIQKDRRSRRWSAGDGKRPIQPVPDFEATVGSPRIAVDAVRKDPGH